MTISMSKCCSARMVVMGSVTMYYSCTKCGMPCDPKLWSTTDEPGDSRQVTQLDQEA